MPNVHSLAKNQFYRIYSKSKIYWPFCRVNCKIRCICKSANLPLKTKFKETNWTFWKRPKVILTFLKLWICYATVNRDWIWKKGHENDAITPKRDQYKWNPWGFELFTEFCHKLPFRKIIINGICRQALVYISFMPSNFTAINSYNYISILISQFEYECLSDVIINQMEFN